MRKHALVALVVLGALPALAPVPAMGQLDAKQSEAAALEARIRAQGQRLSMADEEFNSARLERQRLEADAASVRARVEAAETRWAALRSQLSQRVRMIYMHPGAPYEALLGAKSFGDLARAQKFGSSALVADTELIMTTEKARQEVVTRARALDGLRSEAERKEEELAARRSTVDRELRQQRALLADVEGDVAEILAAQRARELEEARQEAEEAERSVPDAPAAETDQTPDADPAPPTIGDTPPATGSDDDATDEDTSSAPPPSVRSGASKAVATAASQIGKPYEWGADGPDSYDCSGLTMYAWASAGVSIPHSSRAQYSSLPKVSRSELRPGDLVFFGNPIHHVGIYEGGGVMINAPETGEYVRRNSIARSDYVGAARP